MKRWLWYSFMALVSLGMLGVVVALAGTVYILSVYSKDLPDYRQLKDYKPPVVTRIYAGDGRLVAEYAEEKRVFVPVTSIPDIVKESFIAAEDQNFYKHHGVDFAAVGRALFTNIQAMGTGRRPIGASTITQQVAKNFLLTNEVKLTRKIREAILAFRMEKALGKDLLLELYLNEIYLGEGAYGVAAASLNYFNKPLDQLTVEEAAFLAALPKAPNNYSPTKHPDAARIRRDWVIGRLAEDRYITEEQAKTALETPLTVVDRKENNTVQAPYFAEEVRREIIDRYGASSLYEGGLVVRTTLDPVLQDLAQESLRDGLEAFDHRRGWRGPLGKIAVGGDVAANLAEFKIPAGARDGWRIAAVTDVTQAKATVTFVDKAKGTIPLSDLTWTRTALNSVRQVLNAGDVVFVAPARDKDGKETGTWSLKQLPKADGALVAMDPHTGRVLAMQGGWSYEESEFNRATQAKRQPGSAFKPFIYLAALEKGFTPSTLVVDGPVVMDQGPGMPKWAPKNYHNDYNGPTPLRVGVEKSRNLMTVRLAHYVGMDNVAALVSRFGIMDNMPTYLSYALGSGETTVLRLTNGYAQLVNGGRKITPTLIDRIQDRRGATVFAHDTRPCQDCGKLIDWDGQDVPSVPDTREQVTDPRKAYQMVSILEGVVERGTGVAIKSLNRPLAGKTGTTNESKDTWFIGFSPDLVVGVFVGYDNPKPLGKRETGASIAVPIFKEFMGEALKDQPAIPFRVPPGVRNVLVNANTGARAQPGDSKVIWEAFLNGTEPGDTNDMVLDGNGLRLHGRLVNPDGSPYVPPAVEGAVVDPNAPPSDPGAYSDADGAIAAPDGYPSDAYQPYAYQNRDQAAPMDPYAQGDPSPYDPPVYETAPPPAGAYSSGESATTGTGGLY